MAQSPEYPDLKWIPPRSWTNDSRKSVQLIVIHTTEGSAHGQSAEDGAAYDARRTDGTSTHYFHDSNSTVQCVRTEDRAHTARAQGNRRGIQHELCTRGGKANWGDAYHQAMLRRAARQAARDARKWGIPVRKLSAFQVADGMKGFCGHVDITNAFPADGGTHTDPGSKFPWTSFLAMVAQELAPPEPPEETVTTPAQNWGHDVDPSANAYSAGGALWTTFQRTAALNTLPAELQTVREELNARVEDVDDELDGLGATLAFLAALVAEVTNDPAVPEDGGNIWYTTMRQAVKDEMDARSSS